MTPLWIDPATLAQFRGARPAPARPAQTGPAPTALYSPGAEQLFAVATTVVRDAFGRTEPSGWGSADIGGPYAALGARAVMAVDGGTAIGRLDPGSPGGALLRSVDVHDVEILFDVAGDGLETSGVVVSALLRLRPDGAGYRPTIAVTPDGTTLTVRAGIGSDAPALVPAVSVDDATAGAQKLRVRAQAIGSDPTTIRVRLWPTNAPEPLVWHVSVIDWTGSLQHQGSIGLSWSTSAVAPSASLLFDDLVARAHAPEKAL